MKYTAQIVIERPLEKVFFWMFQPEHLVQLVTWDLTKDITRYGPVPPPDYSDGQEDENPELIERIGRQQRFLQQAETKIEIEHLSTLTLQSGTTFDYRMSMRSRSKEIPEFPEFPAWKSIYSGSITIEKSVPPTLFAFTTRRLLSSRGLPSSAEHRLAFQAQQERTIMTYTQLTSTGKIASMIVSTLIPGLVSFGKERTQRKLLNLKTQLELEIN